MTPRRSKLQSHRFRSDFPLKYRSKRLAKNIDPETRKLVKDAMEEWEDEIKAKEKQKEERINSSSLADNIFENLAVKQDYDALSEEDKKKKAESERIKGNEALKSGVRNLNRL